MVMIYKDGEERNVPTVDAREICQYNGWTMQPPNQSKKVIKPEAIIVAEEEAEIEKVAKKKAKQKPEVIIEEGV